ncbi:hypothetical protein WK13_34425 [Burkholderia ubonensis]|uniref:hypothetical protein n=1 Tax=Burkholderia ubonensis TaxID=101571 RepID=UPI000756614D|nr:hypothetical protein [Burkholderia ubonensis]KVR21636.1 hypothetical protein WK13_34425 [Burkholderia ubonensis]
MSETADQLQEHKPETAVVGKTKKSGKVATGDLFFDTAAEIQAMQKGKALAEAEKLNETIEVSYLRMGGVLKLIYDNSWFEGFESFDAYVNEKFGFASRKAKYLIEIYDHLVAKQIPWDKVQHLGWTKLKDLARHLTIENVDEWVAKAEGVTVAELQKLLAGGSNAAGGTAQSSGETSSDIVPLKFKMKTDQADTVKSALSKAKADFGTEFDNVALENICAGFLSGQFGTASGGKSFEEQVAELGFEAALTKIAELFPEWDIDVKPAAK